MTKQLPKFFNGVEYPDISDLKKKKRLCENGDVIISEYW